MKFNPVHLARAAAPIRLATFVLILALLWLPLYAAIEAGVANSNTVSIVAVALLFILFLLLLWAWARRVHQIRRPLRYYGLGLTRQNGLDLLSGLAIGLLSLLGLFGLQAGLGWLVWLSPEPQFARIALEGLLVGIGFGIGEELIFRGWLLDELERDYRLPIALWVSSFLYAVLHYTAPLQDLLGLLFGVPASLVEIAQSLPQFPGLLLLGASLVWAKRTSQGRLGLSVGLHGGLVWGYYLIAVGSLVRYTERVPTWVTGLGGNPLAGAVGLFALGAIALWLRRRLG